MNPRTKLLVSLLAVVLVLVVADRFLLRAGGADDDDALSARRRYLDAARLVAQKRELIEHEADYRAALEHTRERWGQIRASLVTAPSAELAQAQFRDEVLEFAGRRRIEGATTGRIESSPIAEDERLRLMTLRLEFTTASTREVYELVDGLEHMRDLITRVAAVEITGPGRIPSRSLHVSVAIVLETIAYVGEGGGEG